MRILALKTWRDLLAHKGQFGGIVLVVALGAWMFVTYQTVYLDLDTSARRAVRELRFADFSTVVEGAPLGRTAIVRRVPGVRAAEGRLVKDALLELPDGASARARVVGIPDDRRPRVNDLLLTAGRWPVAGRGEALLHVKIAREIGVKPGAMVTVRLGRQRKRLRVTGIAASPEYMYAVAEKGGSTAAREFAVLFMRQHDAGSLFGEPGVMTDVAVLVGPGADPERVSEDVERVLEPYGVVTTVQRADQPSHAGIQAQIDRQRSLGNSVPFLFLGVSSAALLISLSRLVTAQRGEIGLAKALGYGDGHILAHYLLFALLVGLGGSAVGVVVGDAFGHQMTLLYVDWLGLPFVERVFYGAAAARAAVISTLTCVVAGLAPAWRSARIPPARAMHADPNAVLAGGRVPLLEQVLSPALPRSLAFRVPLRNIFRQKKRTLYTVVGVSGAIMMLVLTQAFFDSTTQIVRRLEHGSERWSVQAAYSEPFGAERLAAVRRWKGVRDAHPVLALPAEIRSASALHQGTLTCMEPSADFHGFTVAAGPTPREALEGGGLIVAQKVARRLGVDVGDTVTVTPLGVEEGTVLRVAAISDESLGVPVYAPMALVPRLTGRAETRYNGLYVDAEPRVCDRVCSRLNDIRGAVSVMTKGGMIERFGENLSFMDSMKGMMLGFGLALAFTIIHNTVTANVLERTREIATMRTIGEDAGRLAWMLTLETLLPVVVATPLGLWLGMTSAEWFLAGFGSDEMTMHAAVYPGSFAFIIVGVVVTMLVSEVMPIRRIFRLDLAEATKVLE